MYLELSRREFVGTYEDYLTATRMIEEKVGEIRENVKNLLGQKFTFRMLDNNKFYVRSRDTFSGTIVGIYPYYILVEVIGVKGNLYKECFRYPDLEFVNENTIYIKAS